MANEQNLKPFSELSESEARKIQEKGRAANKEKWKEKIGYREAVKIVLDTGATGSLKESLSNFGIDDEKQTNRVATVLALLKRAIENGDPSAIRLLAELEGELKGGTNVDINVNTAEPSVPLMIPENGRDKPKAGIIGPQPGPQTLFMCSPADIIVYGGAAGGGKTYALLLEALRHMDNSGYQGIIFRKNYNQINAPGGLWDTAMNLYSQIPGAESHMSSPQKWKFKSGADITFAAVDDEKALRSWQGAQFAYIAFDELTHFTKHQFTFMFSRNRTTCGVKPYIRATCNPDADSWVADLIKWYINQDTGYPIPQRSGIIRYMAMRDNEIIMEDTAEELEKKYGIPATECKTFTFIASSLSDNRILMDANPEYLINLKSMSTVDRERLLYGNWKIKPKSGLMFKRGQVHLLEMPPKRSDIKCLCRGWDLAATSEDEKGDPAYTASVLMATLKKGGYCILHVTNARLSAGEVMDLVKRMAKEDKAKYGMVRTRIPQDPGQAGKAQSQAYIRNMAGFDVQARTENGDKTTRAMPVSAQWQHGEISVCLGEWNEMYFDELEAFPDGKFKDMVDATSSAFDELTNYMGFNIDALI